MMPFARFALCIACLSLATSACAHEFWIQPDSFRPDAGSVVRFTLRHGERFLGDPVPRNDDVIERFVVIDSAGERPVRGRSGGRTSVGRSGTAGLNVVAYRGLRLLHELAGEKFDAYLREEGLDRIADLRVQRGESDQPGREVYSRCAKALLCAGSPGAACAGDPGAD